MKLHLIYVGEDYYPQGPEDLWCVTRMGKQLAIESALAEQAKRKEKRYSKDIWSAIVELDTETLTHEIIARFTPFGVDTIADPPPEGVAR